MKKKKGQPVGWKSGIKQGAAGGKSQELRAILADKYFRDEFVRRHPRTESFGSVRRELRMERGRDATVSVV